MNFHRNPLKNLNSSALVAKVDQCHADYCMNIRTYHYMQANLPSSVLISEPSPEDIHSKTDERYDQADPSK